MEVLKSNFPTLSAITSCDFGMQNKLLVFCGIYDSRKGFIGLISLKIPGNISKEDIDNVYYEVGNCGVNCVKVLGNNQILTGSQDHTISLFKLEDKNLLTNIYQKALHQTEISDICTSPCEKYVASCSFDHTIVISSIADGLKPIKLLKGHEGAIKCLTWSNCGKFIASQSDDKSILIWSTSSWTVLKKITSPFEEAFLNSVTLKASWSPDSARLCAPGSMNNGVPSAIFIDSPNWSANLDIVGHKAQIIAVKYSTKVFRRKPGATFFCYVVACKDGSVSLWSSALKRPILYLKNLFIGQIVNISWDETSSQIFIVSFDCQLVTIKISESELINFVDKNISTYSIKYVYKSLARKTSKYGAPDAPSKKIDEFMPSVAEITKEKITQSSPRVEAPKYFIRQSKYLLDCTYEVDNSKPFKLMKYSNTKVIWSIDLQNQADCLCESIDHVAVSTHAGILMLLSAHTGQLIVQPIKFSNKHFFIHLENEFMVAINLENELSQWNLQTMKAVECYIKFPFEFDLKTQNMINIDESGLLTFNEGENSYLYNSDMRSWVAVPKLNAKKTDMASRIEVLKDPLRNYYSQIEISLLKNKIDETIFWSKAYLRYLSLPQNAAGIMGIKLKQEFKNYLVKKKNMAKNVQNNWQEFEKLFELDI